MLTRIDLSLEHFLVVTFTNNAVIELKKRILDYIYQTIDNLIAIKHNNSYDVEDIFIKQILLPQIDNIDKNLVVLTRVVQNFDFASIYTIHGFCNKILKDYQLECKINYPFTLVNSIKPVIVSLTRNFFRENIINNDIFSDNIDIVYRNLERVLDLKNNNYDIIESIVKKLPINKRLFIYTHEGYKIIYKTIDNPDLSILLKENINNNDILNNLLSSVIMYINKNYTKYIKKLNQLDYDSLISIVANSIKYNPDLAQNIYKDFPVAFIDEFQDTDDLQWQIFSEIYHINDYQNGDFLQHKALRGNIIIVGDPKQAIYRFRGADINVYLAAKNSIANVLTLSDNHRQHKDIVNFINQLFISKSNSFCFGKNISYQEVYAKVNQDKLMALPSKEVLQSKIFGSGVNAKIYDTPVQIIAITGDNATEKTEKLYQAITFEILALLSYDPSLVNKIAILVTKNQEANEVVKRLNKYGIKASLDKRINIFSTTTASDLLQILESVCDISNFTLMQKALANNLFNIPYCQLNNFIENSYYLPDGKSIQECFFIYKDSLNKGGIMSLIYALMSDLDIIAKNNQNKLTKREVSNLMQLGELLYKKYLNLNNYAELLYWFKDKIQSALNDQTIDADLDGNSEELIRLDNDEKQITVMTQHKSKGLEFDILFCPFFKKNNELSEGEKSDSLLEFINYCDNNKKDYILTADKQIIQKMLEDENSEINRLNYVALTRAKSRIYIYLNEVKKTRDRYYKRSKTDKIHELFGFVAHDNQDTTHLLFNYPQIFVEPQNAIKDPSLLPGVSLYLRNDIMDSDLVKLARLNNSGLLSINNISCDSKLLELNLLSPDANLEIDFLRQSYSSITHSNSKAEYLDIYDAVSLTVVDNNNYRYEVLNKLRGAKFGVLMHSLCENYPLTEASTKQILLESNIDSTLYKDFMSITEEVFDYKLLNNSISLKSLNNKIHELEFTLSIDNSVNIANDIKRIISNHYGDSHPFTIQCNSLNSINKGFLTGFIDLFFEYDGKYYVLDYKTNSLDCYSSCMDVIDIDNPLLQETARSHYYLQYLLYLVALKRYLELKLKVTDATLLLGGAIYYYIRGIFVDSKPKGGIFFDSKCQRVVAELDRLFSL